METETQIDLAKFQESLTAQRIRTYQITYGGFVLAATLFCGLILLTYKNSSIHDARQTNDHGFLPLMTMVHIVEGTVCYVIAFFLPRFLLSPKRIPSLQKHAQARQLSLEQAYAGVIYTAGLLRTAIMEGIALFGLIICLVGVQSGEIHNQPLYWLNLLSYIIFVFVTLATFPTKERLENIFKETFGIL